MEGPINTDDSDSLGLNIERAPVEEAVEVEQSTGSKYAPLADAWREARADGEALILRGLEKSRVGSIRSFMYRTFNKQDMIVRSKQQSNGELYNVTIRERQNGEYLTEEKNSDSVDDGEDITPSVEETITEETEKETNQYAMSAQ